MHNPHVTISDQWSFFPHSWNQSVSSRCSLDINAVLSALLLRNPPPLHHHNDSGGSNEIFHQPPAAFPPPPPASRLCGILSYIQVRTHHPYTENGSLGWDSHQFSHKSVSCWDIWLTVEAATVFISFLIRNLLIMCLHAHTAFGDVSDQSSYSTLPGGWDMTEMKIYSIADN